MILAMYMTVKYDKKCKIVVMVIYTVQSATANDQFTVKYCEKY